VNRQPNEEIDNLKILRHSTAHLMAQAVKELYPEAKVAIGPAIDTGFYYDFDYEPGFTEDDLAKIEERMHELANKDIPIIRRVIKREEAIELFKGQGEQYKVELLEGYQMMR
jgi:threonyl-tRNA synthetase